MVLFVSIFLTLKTSLLLTCPLHGILSTLLQNQISVLSSLHFIYFEIVQHSLNCYITVQQTFVLKKNFPVQYFWSASLTLPLIALEKIQKLGKRVLHKLFLFLNTRLFLLEQNKICHFWTNESLVDERFQNEIDFYTFLRGFCAKVHAKN